MLQANRLAVPGGKRTGWLFLAFWLFTAIIYFPAYKGGFYEDFLGFLDTYRNMPLLSGIFRKSSGLYYGLNLTEYICIALFRTQPLPWFLVFTGLHALAALSLFRFARSLFKVWQTTYSHKVALAGALLWLLTPLAAEVINWKACMHYMISMIFLLSILKWTIGYVMQPERRTLVKIVVTYFVSLFFLELFYLTPVFVLLLLLSLSWCHKPTACTTRKAIWRIVLPMVLLWCLYYIILLTSTGRTAARTELRADQLFNPFVVSSRYGKYFVHLYFMEYLLPAGPKQAIYRFLNSTAGAAISGLLLLGLTGIGLWRLRRSRSDTQLITILFLLLLGSFVIILPMWFFEMFPYQGSRYFYLPGAFGYLLLACLLFRLVRHARLRTVITGLYLCCNIAGTLYLVKSIREATITGNKLLDQYRWYQGDVLLLNLPVFYKGIGIIGASPANFTTHLQLLRNKTVTNNIYDVSSFNMIGRWDGAHIQVLDSSRLKVTLNQYGTWWWYNGFGASDDENDRYKITFTDNGFSYILQLKQASDRPATVLYQVGGDWKVVDWHQQGEQW